MNPLGKKSAFLINSTHHNIFGAETFGEATEYNLLTPAGKCTRNNFTAIKKEDNIFTSTELTAGCGFHANQNRASRAEEKIAGYMAVRHVLRDDSPANDYGRYTKNTTGKITISLKKQLVPADFDCDRDFHFRICPAGTRMGRGGFNALGGF